MKRDATVTCWGDDAYGRALPPAGSFESVSAGNEHSCGVKSDTTVACWGDNGLNAASPPPGSFESVSAGGEHTCGVKSDATIACWGSDRTGTPPPGSFESVSAGSLHTCGVKSDATIACWGSNGRGQATPPADTFRSADLSVAVTAPASVRTKWSMNYSITVSSNGPTQALNVVLTDQLPAGTTFQGASVPTGWICTFPPNGRAGLVRCTVPSMADTTTATSSLIVKVAVSPNKGPIVNQAQVTSDTFDFDTSNNSATTSTTVTR